MIKLKIFLLFLITFTGHWASSQISDSDFVFIDSCYALSDYYWHTNFDSSYYYLDIAEKRIEDQQLTEDFISLRLTKAQLCTESIQINQLHQELIFNDIILKDKTELYDSIYHNISIYLKQIWGDYYYHIGNHSEAINIYSSIVHSLEQSPNKNNGYDSLLIATNYTTLGETYKKKGQYEKAISYLDKRLTFVPYLNKVDPIRAREGYIYLLKANIYLLKNELSQAADFLKKGFYLNEKAYHNNNIFRGRIISNCYSYSKYHLLKEQPDSAIYYLEKSLDFHIPNDRHYGDTYLKLAEVYTSKKSYSKAKDYLSKALPIFINKYTTKSINTSLVYTALAENELQQGNHQAAIDYQQQALDAICIENVSPKVNVNPKISDSFSEKGLLNALIAKTNILYDLLQKEYNTTNLDNTYKTAQATLSVLNNLRLDKLEAEDKRTLSEQTSKLFDILISTAHQYYDNTKNEQYLSDIFLYMENAKSQILLEQLSDNQAKFNSGLPKEIIGQQQQYLFDIDDLKNKYARHLDKTNPKAIAAKEILWNKQKEYDSFLSELKNNYPEYISNKNSLELISLEESQKLLSKNQSFVNYFISDHFIYIFVINKTNKQLFKTPHQSNLNEQINLLRDGLFGYHLSSNQTEDLYLEKNNLYSKVAHNFYLQLIAPIQEKTTKELIIIPDGILAYIPFEILLTEKPKNSSAFKSMPYLFNDYDIHYAFSISSLSKMKSQKSINQKSLIFAPSFEQGNDVDKSIASIRSGLGELKYNQEEAKQIKTLLGGNLFSNQDANKSSFIEACNQYGIIHIASHGKTNDDKPYQSFIAFGNNEDERLYLSQLSALSLNTEMIVLSACEMGIGKLSKGEGLQSMSSGFVAAGAKSILASLWSVNDASTATIMQDFYSLLSEGKKKNDAISLAKKNYLNDADNFHAHPFFWSGFVLTGDEIGLEFKSFSYWWFVFFGVVFLGIVGYFWRKS